MQLFDSLLKSPVIGIGNSAAKKQDFRLKNVKSVRKRKTPHEVVVTHVIKLCQVFFSLLFILFFFFFHCAHVGEYILYTHRTEKLSSQLQDAVKASVVLFQE